MYNNYEKKTPKNQTQKILLKLNAELSYSQMED